MPNEDMRRYQLPIIPEPQTEPEMLEDEGEEQPEQEQPRESEGKTVWVGAPDAPGQTDDGISDLFNVDSENDTADLVSVDIDRDIIDANEETGDLSDLVEVSEEDILGDEETGQVPLDWKPDAPRGRVLPKYRRTSLRYTPPTSLGGVSG